MKVYTNEGNPFGLKVLLLAKFAQKDVQVEYITINEATKRGIPVLPALEIEEHFVLFSTDAVANFLQPLKESVENSQWLEWSTTQLAPALAHHMGVGHRADPNALVVLNALVKKLDDQLKELPFLTGDSLTTADLSVWALLAPDGTLKGAQHIDHVTAWFRKIEALPEVQQVLAQHPIQNLTFSALQQSNRFGGLHHIALPVPTSGDQTHILAETPASLAATVTEEEINAAHAAFIYFDRPQRQEERTVLPKRGQRNVLITSALPYVNNVPHLGNIIGCVLSADIFARYARLAGYNTLFICGTDEYGTATENKALEENMTPQQICDKYFELHNSIYRWFGIGFDYFGRTTHPEQTEVVQEAFRQVLKNGYILKESVDQLLCQKCDRFLADRFVEGTCPHPGCGYEDARGDQCDKCGKLVNATELVRPRCKVCETAPVLRASEQLFMDLPKIEPQIREWFDRTEHGWSHNARVITRAWLRDGLKPRCITRDLKWGIPVPHAGFENKVFYVWFDAPFGYESITKRYTKEYKQWWQPAEGINVELFQFMAKDNVPFHSVIWPGVLFAMNNGHTVVSNIMATEYLNYEDGKFSKSRGIGVFGNNAQETGIPADVWRFYLAASRPEGQDSSFSWHELAARNNSELLNNLGNFVNRALVFCEKNFNSIVSEVTLNHDDAILLALINRELRGYINSLEKAKLRDGIRHLLSISRHGNGYLQAQQPWVLLKGNDDQQARAASIVSLCCNIAYLLGNLLFPYMPNTSRTLLSQLNAKQTPLNLDKPYVGIYLNAGHKIGKPAPLFSKLESSFIDELKKKYSGVQVTEGVPVVSAAELEKAVQAQADKVRQLKASTKDKTVWQPEINVLLELKKQLAETQQAEAKANAAANNVVANANGVQSLPELELAVQKQAEVVRQLKSNTKDKSVVQPEVNKLLDLKAQLQKATAETAGKETANANATAPSAAAAPADSVADANIKALEKEIAKQGEKVRTLKLSSDASVWKPEVENLLLLKKQLSVLTGAPATAPAQGKNKKKK